MLTDESPLTYSPERFCTEDVCKFQKRIIVVAVAIYYYGNSPGIIAIETLQSITDLYRQSAAIYR